MRRIATLATALVLSASPLFAANNPQLARSIAAKYRSSGQMQGYRVAVKADDGTVYLRGTVRSAAQKRAAERIALQTAGVQSIVSEIDVAGAAVRRTAAVTQNTAPVDPAPAPITGDQPRALALNNANISYDGGYVDGGVVYQGGGSAVGGSPMAYDNAHLPGYAWPSYAASPNYGAVTYPKQYSAAAWPYIGPFYPYPQVPLGWRKVTLEWDDGWWFLNFKDRH